MQAFAVDPGVVTPPRARGRWIYIPHPEEIPVTFQVGLVGTDGVLLASDQKSLSAGAGFQQHFSESKMKCYAENRIAFCTSGGEFSTTVAQNYARRFRERDSEQPWNIEERLLEARDRANEENPKYTQSPDWFAGYFLLAQAIDDRVELWHMHVEPGGLVEGASRVDDRRWIGDVANAAVFFMASYAPLVSEGHQLLPVESLKLLAAHSVLTAGKLNPTGVQGLEMVVCKPERFEFVSQEEIAELRAKSDALDQEIGRRLLINNQRIKP